MTNLCVSLSIGIFEGFDDLIVLLFELFTMLLTVDVEGLSECLIWYFRYKLLLAIVAISGESHAAVPLISC